MHTTKTTKPTITIKGETFTEAELANMIMTRHGSRSADAAAVARSMFTAATDEDPPLAVPQNADDYCPGCGAPYPYGSCECVPEQDFPGERHFEDTHRGQVYADECAEDEARAIYPSGPY